MSQIDAYPLNTGGQDFRPIQVVDPPTGGVPFNQFNPYGSTPPSFVGPLQNPPMSNALTNSAANTLSGSAPYQVPSGMGNGFFPSSYANQGPTGQALIQSAVDQQQRFTDTANRTNDINYQQSLANWRMNGSVGPAPEKPTVQTFDPATYAQNYVAYNDYVRNNIGTNNPTAIQQDFFQKPGASPAAFIDRTPPPPAPKPAAPATPAQTAQSYISNVLSGNNTNAAPTAPAQPPAAPAAAQNNSGGNSALLQILGTLLGGGTNQIGSELGSFLTLLNLLGGGNQMLQQKPASPFYYSRPRFSLFG